MKFKSHDGKMVAYPGGLIVFRGETHETEDEAQIKALENAQDVEVVTKRESAAEKAARLAAEKEAEEKAKKEAAEAEEKAKQEAADAEAKAKLEAEEKAKADAANKQKP